MKIRLALAACSLGLLFAGNALAEGGAPCSPGCDRDHTVVADAAVDGTTVALRVTDRGENGCLGALKHTLASMEGVLAIETDAEDHNILRVTVSDLIANDTLVESAKTAGYAAEVSEPAA